MTWTRLTDLPATRLYEDQYGTVRRRSIETGRFISGTVSPDYGAGGYGATVRLAAVSE